MATIEEMIEENEILKVINKDLEDINEHLKT